MRNKNKPFFYEKKKRPFWQVLLTLLIILVILLIWALSIPGIRQIIAEPLYSIASIAVSFFSDEPQVSSRNVIAQLPTLSLPERDVLFAEDISDIGSADPLAEFYMTPTPEGIRAAEWVFAESTADPSGYDLTTSAQSASLPAPVFERMDLNNDGPAVLSAALRFFGKDENQYTIADSLRPDPLDPSVSFDQMLDYCHAKYTDLGIITRLNATTVLLQNILDAGFPVILRIESRSAYSYWPEDDRIIGRFILLTGFDSQTQQFFYQDPGVGDALSLSFSEMMEKSYTFARQFAVIYPLDQEQKLIDTLADDWSENNNLNYAIDKFKLDTEQVSENALAWHNYGKVLLLSGSNEDAWSSLRHAEEIGIAQRMQFYDSSILEAAFDCGYADNALQLSAITINRNQHIEEVWLWRGWAYLLKGETDDAADAFNKAEAILPGNEDTEYAIKYLSQYSEESR